MSLQNWDIHLPIFGNKLLNINDEKMILHLSRSFLIITLCGYSIIPPTSIISNKYNSYYIENMDKILRGIRYYSGLIRDSV